MSYDSPPPPPPPQYGAPVPPAGAPGPTNKKAVWSLVLGIVSIVCCGLGIIAGGVAIFLAQGARREIAARNESGAGLASAGLITGIIGVALSVIYFILLAVGSIDYNFSTN